MARISKNVEQRAFGDIVRSTEAESRLVEGYALVFDKESEDLGGFIEKIDSRSLDGVLEISDVLVPLNHDVSRGILARSKKLQGSLSLEIDDKGLKYRFNAPKTALGDELLEGLERGDITASSFAFRVADNGEIWEKREDGSYLRTITKFDRISDVSPVYVPAYPDTSVAKRGLESLVEVEKEELRKAQEAEELKMYFNNLEKQLQ